MITLFLTKVEKPKDVTIDVSDVSLDLLTETLINIYSHHQSAVIWIGYLEGWMLSPIEETLLRKVIRKFPCYIVTNNVFSFSHAWKNETICIHS
jgi:hypothetical protein